MRRRLHHRRELRDQVEQERADVGVELVGLARGAARVAANHGAKVMVAEEFRIGGTCVIRGCVPKKLFVYASKYADDFEDAVGFGWRSEKVSFDWPTLVAGAAEALDLRDGFFHLGLCVVLPRIKRIRIFPALFQNGFARDDETIASQFGILQRLGNVASSFFSGAP